MTGVVRRFVMALAGTAVFALGVTLERTGYQWLAVLAMLAGLAMALPVLRIGRAAKVRRGRPGMPPR